MTKTSDRLPLISFFYSLRYHDFELGMDEYYMLIKALSGGFGLESETALLFVCKKLWLKSKDKEELFERLFKEEFGKEKQLILEYLAKEKSDGSREEKVEPEKEKPEIDNPRPDEDVPKEDPAKPLERPDIKKETETVEDDQIKLSIETVKADGSKKIQKGIRKGIAMEKFILKGSFLSENENRFKYAWRFFRKIEKEGETDQLDIDGTINEIAKNGFLFKPVFMPARVNKAGLLTLIDHDGSMAAFSQLAQSVSDTSTGEGTVSNRIYYFYNVPGERLFKNKAHTRAEKMESVLCDLVKMDAAVLIISDAGAARGLVNADRIDITWNFIEELKKRTHRIAWLNPMPQDRWGDTSAQYIKSFVPMFEATEFGLRNAVKLLRGKLDTEIFLKN